MIEKAIAFFDEEIRRLESAPNVNGCKMTEEWAEQIEICKAAKSSLEKQTPKKPKRKPLLSLYSCFPILRLYYCPTCGNLAEKYITDAIYPRPINHFCHRCGQALDWGNK